MGLREFLLIKSVLCYEPQDGGCLQTDIWDEAKGSKVSELFYL